MTSAEAKSRDAARRVWLFKGERPLLADFVAEIGIQLGRDG
jgi:hypothetical protein